MPGWETSTESVRTFEDLPENARKYVELIEEKLELPGRPSVNHRLQMVILSNFKFFFPVRWIGVGKDRGSMIQLY